MEIVPFTPQDQQKTAVFMKDIFEEMGWPYSTEDFYDLEKIFHMPHDGFLFLIKESGNVVGTAGCIKLTEKEMLLKRFYIAKKMRGSGIAQKLLDQVVEEAKKFTVSRIVLDVIKTNPQAIRFYEKNGFVPYQQSPIAGWSETKRPDIFKYYFLEI